MLRIHLEVGESLDARWTETFGGLAIDTRLDRRGTALFGCVRDYSALYGILGRCRDLGLKIRSLEVEERA